MKRLSLLLFVGLSLAGTTWAQQAGSTHNLPSGAPPAGASKTTITPEEWQELRAAHTAALQANPDLTAEHTKLMERMRTFEDKLDAAMIKINPAIAPIIAKFEVNRPHPGAPAGSPPAAPPAAK